MYLISRYCLELPQELTARDTCNVLWSLATLDARGEALFSEACNPKSQQLAPKRIFRGAVSNSQVAAVLDTKTKCGVVAVLLVKGERNVAALLICKKDFYNSSIPALE
eukprot:2672879-Amphidinium_carterae.2